ncbi:unnamed protein product [Tenebrio molitor]|nr:unnamed protein product [Tenebrio molitor]
MQMVCNTCCQMTIKMYKFLTSSMKNNRDLKTKCPDHNFPQLTHTSVHFKNEPNPTSCTSSKAVMNQIAKLKREACEVASKSPKKLRKQPREERKQQTNFTSDAKKSM